MGNPKKQSKSISNKTKKSSKKSNISDEKKNLTSGDDEEVYTNWL